MQTKVCHSNPLEKADLVVMFCGGLHYVAADKSYPHLFYAENISNAVEKVNVSARMYICSAEIVCGCVVIQTNCIPFSEQTVMLSMRK